MSLIILMLMLIFVWRALTHFREWRKPTGIWWTLLTNIDHSAALVRDASVECFGTAQRRWVEGGSIDFYERGNLRIIQVSSPRDVRLADIPSLFSVAVVASQGKTEITLRIDISWGVRMRRSVAKQFDGAAEAELSCAVAQLRRASARLEKARAAHGRTVRSAAPDMDADYALLGLERGASPEQVLKAYRIACRKYHPDRLTGQNVEPHLVELAVQRFKETGAAYQRIHERHPQARRA